MIFNKMYLIKMLALTRSALRRQYWNTQLHKEHIYNNQNLPLWQKMPALSFGNAFFFRNCLNEQQQYSFFLLIKTFYR